MKYYTKRDDTKHKTKNFPLAYYHVDKTHPRYYLTHHWHHEFEIMHIISGEFELYIDRKTYNLKAGDFALISPGSVHSGNPNGDDCDYECAVFDLEAFLGSWKKDDKYISGLITHRFSLPEIYKSENGVPEAAMLNIMEVLRRQDEGFELETLSSILKLIYLLVKRGYLRESKENYTPSRIEPLNKAITYIEQNFNKIIKLDDIAAYCGISPSYFSEYFRKTTGFTPFDYINNYRVDCASEMLIYTKKTITEIAISCGFNDSSYFSKTFRAYKGRTPREYRLEHNNIEK